MTELHFNDPRKQNHYERWLAERAIEKTDNCGCVWCLEFAQELDPLFKPLFSNQIEMDIQAYRKRGKPRVVVTPDQQAILNRTDLSIRQKSERSGLAVSTVGRLTKK